MGPTVEIVSDGDDLFVLADGVKISGREARRVTLTMACIQCPCSLGRHDPRCGRLPGKKSKARLWTSRVAASLWTYAPLYPHAARGGRPNLYAP
jgi:hypothetical protein